MDETGNSEHSSDDPPGARNVSHAGNVHSIVQVGNVAGDLNMVAPVPPRPVPRQVLDAPMTFVDRDDTLTWLSERLVDPDQPPGIAVVAGVPGVGKNTAARRWVHRVRHRFDGGVLRVDCADFGASAPTGTVDVSAMVACCLRALGVDDTAMPAALAERVAWFRSLTAADPVLVVVANATEPAQVTSLIPNAPGSLVLVTTASDLTELRLDGAAFHRLDRLDEASSTELFGRVCGPQRVAAEPRSTADLMRWCAGLPIAITVLAARVAGTSGMAIAELAGELSDKDRRLPGMSLGERVMVSAAFTASYERLPAPARHLYRRLGLLPGGTYGPELAAVVSGLDPGEARRLLDVLVRAYLVERPADGPYRFHELVGLHARECAKEEPAQRRDAAVRAVVEHYLVRAAFADRVIVGTRARATDHGPLLAGHRDPFTSADGGNAKERAFAWLDAEQANLVPVVRAAVARGWDAEAWQLAEALMAYYYNHRHLTDWVTVAGLGAQAARRCGNLEAEVRLRLGASRADTDLGELDSARQELDIAADLAQRGDDPGLQASVWEFRGRYLDVTAPQEALAAYERALDLNIRADEWRGVALVTFYSGRTLAAAGRHADALEAFRQARDLFLSRCQDGRNAARVLIDLGAAQDAAGRADDARASLDAAVTELAEGRYTHYEAQAREVLAGIAERAGDHAAAQRHLRRAVAIHAEHGNPRAEQLAGRLDGTA